MTGDTIFNKLVVVILALWEHNHSQVWPQTPCVRGGGGNWNIPGDQLRLLFMSVAWNK